MDLPRRLPLTRHIRIGFASRYGPKDRPNATGTGATGERGVLARPEPRLPFQGSLRDRPFNAAVLANRNFGHRK